jgi:Tfp pilus assembly protein PilO
VEQIAQVNALQQQLIRCQERVKNLSRQLNDAEHRLQEEQQKNRSLRGE